MMYGKQEAPLLVSVLKIWDVEPHNALTDLIWYQDFWYCAFRESDQHVFGKNGRIRLLKSSDYVHWEACSYFELEGVDLRDPKLSVTPSGELLILMGGTVYAENGAYITRQSRVSLSRDGNNWSAIIPILKPHEWLWRITWHNGKAYGFSYRFSDPQNHGKEWFVTLFESQDGINYQKIVCLSLVGYPNETTLRFMPSGEMIALLRRDKEFDNHAWIGISQAPYKKWQWMPTALYFGGPNFLVIENGEMWAAGRIMYRTPYGLMEKTVLAEMTKEDLNPVLVLPSGGDTSYPGLVYREGFLWMSYYSSHEANTAIYAAKILLP